MTQGHEIKVSSFDEWYFKQNHLGIEPIDHLKQRLVDVLNTIESSEEISHMLYRKVYKILKGESNE